MSWGTIGEKNDWNMWESEPNSLHMTLSYNMICLVVLAQSVIHSNVAYSASQCQKYWAKWTNALAQ